MIRALAPPSLTVLGAAAIAVLLAGVLRGFTGFGFGLAATPLLALVMPPTMVVPIVLILQAGSSMVGLRSTLHQCDRGSSLAMISLSAMVATPVGISLLTLISPGQARMAIAAVSALGLFVFLSGFRLSQRPGTALTVSTGLAAGVLNGLCAMPGPPVLAYYLSGPMSAATSRASMILIFLATGIIGLLIALFSGLLTHEVVFTAAIVAPFMVIGTMAGSRLFATAPSKVFRNIALSSLGLIAITSALRAWF